MKEKLYTIPVTDAFAANCECPICTMKKELEINAVSFAMGPSYMEDDIRAKTDKSGFCEKHIKMMYEDNNKLGLALMLKTHMDQTIKDLEKLALGQEKPSSPSLFKKKTSCSGGVVSYIKALEHSCFICSRIEHTFDRYIATVYYLYKTDEGFRSVFAASKGMCTAHYGLLYEKASEHLSGSILNEFIPALNRLYIENMKRVRDDVDWFIDKFDYRFAKEPWKNSKDALPRAMAKTNGVS